MGVKVFRSDYKTIRCEVKDRVARITFSRPEVHNAFNNDMIAEMLQHIDTSGIPPTTSALPLHNVMRADEINPSITLTNEEALFNAPQTEAGSFKVKAVLD